MKKIILFCLGFSFIASHTFAQQKNNLESLMRSNGKIYVVVAVLGVILVGIFGYLWTMERKLSKLEKEIQNQH